MVVRHRALFAGLGVLAFLAAAPFAGAVTVQYNGIAGSGQTDSLVYSQANQAWRIPGIAGSTQDYVFFSENQAAVSGLAVTTPGSVILDSSVYWDNGRTPEGVYQFSFLQKVVVDGQAASIEEEGRLTSVQQGASVTLSFDQVDPVFFTIGNNKLEATITATPPSSGWDEGSAHSGQIKMEFGAVPEPFTLALCGAGLGLAIARRRKAKKA